MVNKQKFTELKDFSSDHCISIYIPTVISGDYEKNRIKWKNAIQEAEKALEDKGLSAKEINNILKDAKIKIDDSDFWANQSNGLAGFFSNVYSEIVHLTSKPEQLSHIADTFYIYPLLSAILNEDRIFILALSKNEVRFFEAHREAIFPVHISDVVPKNMEKALMLDKDEEALQWHTGGQNNESNYHGHGAGEDDQNIRLKQYFREIDKGLMKIIHDEQVPLVTAGVEGYHTRYKEISDYNFISDFHMVMNPEASDPVALHTEVIPLFEKMACKRKEEFVSNFNIKEKESLTSVNLKEIYNAAKFQNIDALCVNKSYYSNLGKDHREKLDDIIQFTFENGGDILLVENDDIENIDIMAIKRFEMDLVSE